MLSDFHFFFLGGGGGGLFLRLLENQKADESTLFPGGVSVKFWNDLLGLELWGKELYTNTQLHMIHGAWELRNLFCGLMEWRSGVLKWSGVKVCVVG